MLGFQSRAPQPSVADLHKCKAPNTHRNGGMLRVGCSRPPGKPWAWEVVAAPADVCGRQRCGSNEADEGRGRLLAATCRSPLKQDIQTIRRPQPKADSVRMIAKGRRRRGPLGPCWALMKFGSTARLVAPVSVSGVAWPGLSQGPHYRQRDAASTNLLS